MLAASNDHVAIGQLADVFDEPAITQRGGVRKPYILSKRPKHKPVGTDLAGVDQLSNESSETDQFVNRTQKAVSIQ